MKNPLFVVAAIVCLVFASCANKQASNSQQAEETEVSALVIEEVAPADSIVITEVAPADSIVVEIAE